MTMQAHAGALRPTSGDEAHACVSALMDGEVAGGDIDSAIDALLASDELARFWSDCHVAGDWMRSDEVVGVGHSTRFMARFSAALAAEPAIVALAKPASGRPESRLGSKRFWVRTGLPGASIAAAMVIVAWVATPVDRADAPVATAAPTIQPVVVRSAESEPAVQPVAARQRVDPEQFGDYVAAHGEVSPFAYRGAAARQTTYVTTVESGTPPAASR